MTGQDRGVDELDDESRGGGHLLKDGRDSKPGEFNVDKKPQIQETWKSLKQGSVWQRWNNPFWEKAQVVPAGYAGKRVNFAREREWAAAQATSPRWGSACVGRKMLGTKLVPKRDDKMDGIALEP
jgi:hypothetical protein